MPQLLREQQDDEDLKEVSCWVDKGEVPPKRELCGNGTNLRTYAGLFNTLRKNPNGILYRERLSKDVLGLSNEPVHRVCFCVPLSLKKQVIQACHEKGGHMGMTISTERVLRRYYFPGAHAAIRGHIHTCLTCQTKRGKDKDQFHTLMSFLDGTPL